MAAAAELAPDETINLRVKTTSDETYNLAVPGNLRVSLFKERIEVAACFKPRSHHCAATTAQSLLHSYYCAATTAQALLRSHFGAVTAAHPSIPGTVSKSARVLRF
jgi:hypothetical protein